MVFDLNQQSVNSQQGREVLMNKILVVFLVDSLR